MAELATRGDFAESLYTLLGMDKPTSTTKFQDAGGAASTLFDLGITNGIGEGQYGSDRPITRGEVFLMIARTLGMADSSTDPAYAANLLVEAGIIKGYGGDTSQLGLTDPIEVGHLDLLLNPETGRIAPLMDDIDDRTTGATLRDTLLSKADDARQTNIAENDPAFATFLAQQGVKKDEVAAAVEFAQGQHELNLEKIRANWADTQEDRLLENRNSWSGRGLGLSGMVERDATEIVTDVERAQGNELFSATNLHESWLQEQRNLLAQYDRDLLSRATQAETDITQEEIADAYDYTFGYDF